MGAFHPDDLKNPLYEHSQVVTIRELYAVQTSIAHLLNETRWWNIRRRLLLLGADSVITELMYWLHIGKPAYNGGVKNENNH